VAPPALYVGMTGFDSVILAVPASIRDGDGSRYPQSQPINASTAFEKAAAAGEALAARLGLTADRELAFA